MKDGVKQRLAEKYPKFSKKDIKYFAKKWKYDFKQACERIDIVMQEQERCVSYDIKTDQVHQIRS